MYGPPFGAIHAVHNFNRVAEYLCRLIRRFFNLVMDHYFDDYFLFEPEFSIKVALFCFREAMSAFGFVLDPEKSSGYLNKFNCLGVLFNFMKVRSEGKVVVEPKPDRIANLRKEIEEILRFGYLRPARAGKLVGKLQFVSDSLFGKVGRAGLGRLRV